MVFVTRITCLDHYVEHVLYDTPVLELYVLLLLFLNTIGNFFNVNFTLIRRLLPARPPPPPPNQNRLRRYPKLTEYVIHIHSTMTTSIKPPEPSKLDDRIDRIWLFF
jgi:hypothetical protein